MFDEIEIFRIFRLVLFVFLIWDGIAGEWAQN